MSDEPESPKQPNVRTVAYKEMLSDLPEHVGELAQRAYELFLKNPQHTSLRWHELEDNRKSHQRPKSVSVSITMMYRAIYVPDDGQNVWYWIGTHADYKAFTGSKR